MVCNVLITSREMKRRHIVVSLNFKSHVCVCETNNCKLFNFVQRIRVALFVNERRKNIVDYN